MRLISTFIFCIVSIFGISQDKSVLFIGNSFTGAYNLPELVQNIALSKGETMIVDASMPGGSRFQTHKVLDFTLDKIASRNWDYVVLQEHVQLAVLPEEIAGDAYSPPHATDLNAIIKDNYACTEVVFYMTWGIKYGDAFFCDEYPPVCTYEGMQDELRDAHIAMANDYGGTVSPAGEAWRAVINEDPDIELYDMDGGHPNINGAYLTACVMFATIYQSPSVGATFTADIDDELALFFQTKADEIVFGSPDIWRIGFNELSADFYFEEFSPMTYSFTSEDETVDEWEWTIDGILYTEENPTHTFPEYGSYEIELKALNDCDTIISTEILTLTDLGLNNTELHLSIYPNPNQGIFKIKSNVTSSTPVTILDMSGRTIIDFQIDEKETEISLDLLPDGIYILQIRDRQFKICIQ